MIVERAKNTRNRNVFLALRCSINSRGVSKTLIGNIAGAMLLFLFSSGGAGITADLADSTLATANMTASFGALNSWVLPLLYQ